MDKLLKVTDLTISYGGGVDAINNINFSLGYNEVIGIVGESGSGKTTLIRTILNLLPEIAEISSGKILYKDRLLSELNSEEWINVRGNEIAAIFQSPSSYLNPIMKIKKQFIETIRANIKSSKKDATDIAVRMLKKMNLKDVGKIMDSYPFELSGGELQRIVITRAMTVEPSVIIFDEATSALDVTTQRQILELLIGLKKKTNFAAIFVSHDIALVQKLADRIYVMLDGKVVESFKKENLRSDNRKEYTKLLTNAGFSIEETKISLINDDYVRSGVNVETKSKQKKR